VDFLTNEVAAVPHGFSSAHAKFHRRRERRSSLRRRLTGARTARLEHRHIQFSRAVERIFVVRAGIRRSRESLLFRTLFGAKWDSICRRDRGLA